MTGDVHARRLLITGGSSGIGAATAERLVKAGATVAIVARSRSRLDAVATQLGERCHPVVADLADDESLPEVIERTLAALGGLDTMVLSAARADWMPFDTLDRGTFDAMFALNVWAPLRLVQLARPHLEQATDPAVVMIGSVDAERPSPGAVAYGATKAALTAAMVALTKELAPIRFAQVNPGLIDTPMVADVKADLDEQDISINLAGRFGRPEEIAALIHYLVSPLGRFANGSVFRVDGGALVMGPFDATRSERTTSRTSRGLSEPEAGSRRPEA